jgi:hypothetical protein
MASMRHAVADTLLAQNGKTSYVISVAADAIPAEKTAATQVQKYLQQVTGATFAIASETDVKADAPQILVGAGARVKALLPTEKWSALQSDAIIIKTVGKNIVLAGGRPRGSLYAAIQFLEDGVGCRWWTPTESAIPRKSTLNVPTQNVSYASPFAYREHYTTAAQKDPEFATFLRENGHHQTQDEAWGGHYKILGWCHTFEQLVSLEVYFKDHPEWYSDPANDNKPCTKDSPEPFWNATQLNLSNPELLEELTKNALKLIATNPSAGYISISQNDNRNYCRDPESVALVKAEGSEVAPILNFVNKVAARIHEKYPDFLVETLAYNGTEAPPKTLRPGKNVIIRQAPIWSDYGHPLNSDWNPAARENLVGWAKIAPKLFVWNYVTNFDNMMSTHPNWQGLADDLRFFAANNVQGVFEQGDAETNGVGDFVQLRAWLLAKLMWNPQLDQEKLTNEFLKGYYGAAAPYLKQHLDLIQKSFLSQNKVLSTYNRDFTFFTLEVANKSIQLWDQAEASVKNDNVLLQRVKRERLSVKLAMLHRYNSLQRAAAREGKDYLGPKDPIVALTALHQEALAFGADAGERNLGADFPNLIPRLTQMLAPPVALPEFAKAFPENDVIDLQPGTFTLHEPGKLTAMEADPKASNNTAASVIGDAHDWCLKAPAGRFLDSFKDKWRIHAIVRMERKAEPAAMDAPRERVPNQEQPPSDVAFQIGLYDLTSHKILVNDKGQRNVEIKAEDLKGTDYQTIDFGVYALDSAATFVYFQPVHNPAVNKIYVDRVILTREKSTP